MKELLVRKSSLLRGLLSLFFLMAMVGNVWGDEVTFIPGTDTSTETKITKGDITLTATTFSNASYYQTFKTSNFKVESAAGNITKVEITCTASGTTKYGPGCYTGATTGTYSVDGTVGTWTGDAASFSLTASENQVRMTKIVVTYTADANTASAPTLTSSCTFTSASMDATITNNETGATVYYTTDGTAPTTSSSSFTGASKTINITATTTVKAMAVVSGKTNSSVATATYTKGVAIENTAETAYTTAEAIALINTGNSLLTTTEVYIKGTISKIDSYNANYGSITYWLDDNAFEIYGGLNNNGAKFNSIDDIKVGAEVIVKGIIKKYGSSPVVYETDKNSWLVSYTAPAVTKNTATLTLGTYTKTISAGLDDEYTVTYNGDGTVTVTSSDPTVASATLADGKITISAIKAGTTTITIAAAETDNYTAVEKSYTVTVTDPAPTADLPFSFDGGKGDIAGKTGMTQYGLSTDYSISPKLKFDGAGDYVIINYSSSAKNVSYKLKGNNTDENTVFDVLESADGKTYTTVHSFAGTDVPSNATSYTDMLKADSRYVKFVYTTKGGNIGLGAITISNEKADPGLAFEQSTYRFFNYTEGLAVKATSSKGSTGAITYSVEEGDASALDFKASTGSIYAESDGTFTIQATIAETEDYKEATATCTVIFKSRPSANSIIVAETTDGKYYAMTNTWNSNGYIESVQIAKIGDKYYVGDNKEAISYCVNTSDGKTIIENMSGQYLQATAAKKVSFTDDEYEWTNDGTTLTAATSSYGLLRFNPSDPRFTTYTGTTGRNVQIVDINKVSYNMSYDRTGVTDGKYGTICLPYAVAADGMHGIEKCYTATISGNYVTLEEVDALEAGKPYIFLANDDFITLDMSGTPATATTNGCLTGVFKATEVPVGAYVMQTKDDEQKFYKVKEGSQPKLSANKAYLTVPAASASDVKAFSLAEGGNETALKTIEALTNNNAKIYDINGRELKTLQKGINIVNGVKVLVK